MDVHNIPGEEIRDFVPLGELKMLIVSYNGIVSITNHTEVVCQMNMHLTKDEVTKALALDASGKYFCVSVKNSNPMVPSLRFYKINSDKKSFTKLGEINFLEEDIIRSEFSYFFAINFEAVVNGRPILTAFQCCNEFRVYSYYIDENEKVQKIGYRNTDNYKFVWDCKYYNGTVYALDRDLNLTTVTYHSCESGNHNIDLMTQNFDLNDEMSLNNFQKFHQASAQEQKQLIQHSKNQKSKLVIN